MTNPFGFTKAGNHSLLSRKIVFQKSSFYSTLLFPTFAGFLQNTRTVSHSSTPEPHSSSVLLSQVRLNRVGFSNYLKNRYQTGHGYPASEALRPPKPNIHGTRLTPFWCPQGVIILLECNRQCENFRASHSGLKEVS